MLLNRQCLIVVFIMLLAFCETFKPDCDITNQFRYYCFRIEHCSSTGKCAFDRCGYYYNSTSVLILQADIIPQCAFTDSPWLTRIIGRNKRISAVAVGSFINLPNLQEIDLSLNSITTLHEGTFKNVAAQALDLSWNKLKYIPTGAFTGLKNLQYLSLSRNDLKSFPVHKLPKTLIGIYLSHNSLERFALSTHRAPSLSFLDVSHNQLRKLALQFDHEVKNIDIAGNNLERIDYCEVDYCEAVNLALNQFTSVPDILMISSLRQAVILPNPWQCDELEQLLPILSMNSVEVLEYKKTIQLSEQPICGYKSQASKLTLAGRLAVSFCSSDFQCGKAEVCRNNKCFDPCRENVCERSRRCSVVDHFVICECFEPFKEDPEYPQEPCRDVECFRTSDCRPHTYCRNNTCIIEPELFSSNAEYTSSRPTRPTVDLHGPPPYIPSSNNGPTPTFGNSSQATAQSGFASPSFGYGMSLSPSASYGIPVAPSKGFPSAGYGIPVAPSNGIPSAGYGAPASSSYGDDSQSISNPTEDEGKWWENDI